MSHHTNAATLTADDLPKLRNIPVISAEGEEIGHVGDAYYDENTGALQFIGIEGDWLGLTKRVVPVKGAELRDDDRLYLHSGREQIGGSPAVESDDFDDAYLDRLKSHYTPETTDADAAITRSEEELAVGKREVPAGAVRIRKWVETEPVEMDVELQRETARVTREPIDRPASDADFGEEEVEVQLRAEQPVVAKEAVAKERIGIEKDVQTERQVVQDEVRKERVEVDEDADVEPR